MLYYLHLRINPVYISEIGLTPQESYVYRKASISINIRPQPGSNKLDNSTFI
jgi:hypothetical protein